MLRILAVLGLAVSFVWGGAVRAETITVNQDADGSSAVPASGIGHGDPDELAVTHVRGRQGTTTSA